MAETTKAEPTGKATEAEKTAEDKPKRDTFRAESFLETAVRLVKGAGESGLSVKDLGAGLKAAHPELKSRPDTHIYRIAHNVGWTLEGQPVYRAGDEEHTAVTRPDKRQIRRLPGSSIRYVFGAGTASTKTGKQGVDEVKAGKADYALTKKAMAAQKSAQAA